MVPVGLLSVWWCRFLILLPVYEDDQNLNNNLHRKHPQWLFDLSNNGPPRHWAHTTLFFSFQHFQLTSHENAYSCGLFYGNNSEDTNEKKTWIFFKVLTVHEDFHTGCQYWAVKNCLSYCSSQLIFSTANKRIIQSWRWCGMGGISISYNNNNNNNSWLARYVFQHQVLFNKRDANYWNNIWHKCCRSVDLVSSCLRRLLRCATSICKRPRTVPLTFQIRWEPAVFQFFHQDMKSSLSIPTL